MKTIFLYFRDVSKVTTLNSMYIIFKSNKKYFVYFYFVLRLGFLKFNSVLIMSTNKYTSSSNTNLIIQNFFRIVFN